MLEVVRSTGSVNATSHAGMRTLPLRTSPTHCARWRLPARHCNTQSGLFRSAGVVCSKRPRRAYSVNARFAINSNPQARLGVAASTSTPIRNAVRWWLQPASPLAQNT
eukprot:4655177-Alexandrium_andersonii.AAC.1